MKLPIFLALSFSGTVAFANGFNPVQFYCESDLEFHESSQYVSKEIGFASTVEPGKGCMNLSVVPRLDEPCQIMVMNSYMLNGKCAWDDGYAEVWTGSNKATGDGKAHFSGKSIYYTEEVDARLPVNFGMNSGAAFLFGAAEVPADHSFELFVRRANVGEKKGFRHFTCRRR